MTLTPPSSRPERTGATRLALWSRAAGPFTVLAAGLGIAHYALYAGFAWCAAGALAALLGAGPAGSWLILACVFALARALVQAGEVRCGVQASTRVRAFVRGDAARALARRGPAYTERTDSGQTASLLIDAVDKLDGYFARYRPLIPVVAGGPLILLAGAFAISPAGAGILAVSAPLLVILMALAGAGAAAASQDQLATLTRLAGRFNDRFQALETLVAFNAAEREAETLGEASQSFREKTMRVLRRAFLSSLVLELFSAFAIAAIAIFVGLSLLRGGVLGLGEELTLHEGVFLLLIAPEFFMPLRRLSAAYHDHADAKAGTQALEPLYAENQGQAPSAAAPPFARAPQLRFEAVTSRYADGRLGLHQAAFTVPAGEITALWGTSGAGKSTALKVLMGYAPLSGGTVLVDGAPLSGALLGAAAWIGQRPRLFHGTLAQNITLFDPSITQEAIEAAAEQAGVMEFAASLPDGLDTPLGERGYGLSGGQAQRVALARALASDRKLLLLDEPTAHLDGEAEARFLQALQTAATGRTALIATHSPAVRAICSHHVEFSQGRAA